MANKNTQVIEVVTKGANKSKQQLKGVSGGLKNLAKQAAVAAGAYFGARALLGGIQASIDLFAKQELAEKKLEAALGKTSQKLLNQAKAIQQVTMFGDEQVIEAQALIGSFVKEEEAIMSATQATLDLAAAKGMELTVAADLVSKTLGSSTNALSRYGIEVTGAVGSTERLESLTGNLAKVFGGQATEQANTLAGQMQQMKNAAGDAAEALGETLAPMAVKIAGAIKSAAETFQSFFQEANESNLETLIRETKELGGNTTELELALNEVNKSEAMAKLGSDLRDVSTIEEDITAKQNARREYNKFQIAHLLKVQELLKGETDAEGNILSMEELRFEFLTGKRNELKDLDREQIQHLFTEFDQNKAQLDLFDEKIEKLKQEQADTAEINRLELEKEAILAKQKTTEDSLLKVKNDSNKSTDDKIKKESKLSKLRKEKNREAALAEINSAMASAKANLINQIMKAVPFPLNLLLAKGASGRIDKLFNKINVKTAQYGADFVTDGPQMMMVGEGSGPERVQVTPLVDENREGPQGQGITLNISGNVLHDSFVEDSVVPQIREALRMGENLGA